MSIVWTFGRCWHLHHSFFPTPACYCRHEGNIPAALKQYESLRHKRAAALLQHSRSANSVANLQNPVAAAARDVLLRGIVRVQGTIPSNWLWQYDCEAAVAN
jgi:2-polyprenyl-6-methoxyphenol hydroxylase-like FAD-dependent oxidoreductase